MSDQPPYDIQPSAPNIIIRILWFVLVGWWLGGIVSAIAWFLNITIIGLPPGLYLINRLPTIITLRPQEQNIRVEHGVVKHGQDQQPFMLRALYFALVGWWLSGLWLAAAYAALMTVILIPASFWMYNRIGAVTTLYRS
jgi:uncharacterized membrane protein YccF (DUF307 family)